MILASARSHGIADDETLPAYRNPIRTFELDDLVMLVGPGRSTTPLEIGVAHAEGIGFIVHTMVARPRLLE